VIDAQTATRLQNLLRRQSRSFLRFVADAQPWATTEERALLDKLMKLIEDEAQGTTALAQFMLRQHIDLPYLGTYPESFTNMSFVSLDYLLPRLVEEEKHAVKELEADVRALQDQAARRLVQKLLDQKLKHVPILEGMVSLHSQVAIHS
jgi:hypothetical protein